MTKLVRICALVIFKRQHMQTNEYLEEREAVIDEMEGEFGPLPITKLEVFAFAKK